MQLSFHHDVAEGLHCLCTIQKPWPLVAIHAPCWVEVVSARKPHTPRIAGIPMTKCIAACEESSLTNLADGGSDQRSLGSVDRFTELKVPAPFLATLPPAAMMSCARRPKRSSPRCSLPFPGDWGHDQRGSDHSDLLQLRLCRLGGSNTFHELQLERLHSKARWQPTFNSSGPSSLKSAASFSLSKVAASHATSRFDCEGCQTWCLTALCE